MNDIRIKLPEDTFKWIGSTLEDQKNLIFTDKLGSKLTLKASRDEVIEKGLAIPSFPAKTAVYLEIK